MYAPERERTIAVSTLSTLSTLSTQTYRVMQNIQRAEPQSYTRPSSRAQAERGAVAIRQASGSARRQDYAKVNMNVAEHTVGMNETNRSHSMQRALGSAAATCLASN